MKVRICSKTQTNSATTFIVQPPIAPRSNSQPPHQYVHVPVPTIPDISYVYSENEEEENEEAEMQAISKGLQLVKEHGSLISLVSHLNPYNVIYSYVVLFFRLVLYPLNTNVFIS